jgi:hypothetical protein
MDDGLNDRVDAVERAITDGHAADGLPETARMERRLDDLEATVEDIDDRLADVEAAVQALRGFAGGIRAVDEEVERRANAAVAQVERLETEMRDRAEMDGTGAGPPGHTDTGNDNGRGGSEVGAVDGAADETDGVEPAPSSVSSHPVNGAGRTDAALAATAAEAADTADHHDTERVGSGSEAGREAESLADRIRRLL